MIIPKPATAISKSIRIQPDLHELITKICDEQQIDYSHCVNYLIRYALNSDQKAA